MFLRILTAILLLGLTACATTIGNKNDLRTAEFKLNETKKSEVADYLGLPSKISNNEEEKKQYWYYTDGAKLSGLIVPVVATGQTTNIYTGSPSSDLDYAAMFVFDENDILIEVSK